MLGGSQKNNSEFIPWRHASILQSCKKLGLQPMDILLNRTDSRRLNKVIPVMKALIPSESFKKIQYNSPRPYPNMVPMDKFMMYRPVIHCWRFQVSLAFFITNKCDFCGRLELGHAYESFQLQMGFPFPFLRGNDLRSSLLIMRTCSFLLSCR